MSESLALHNASWPLSIPKHLGHYLRGDFGSSHFMLLHFASIKDIKEKKQILKCAKKALGLLIILSIFYEAPHAFNIKVF